LITLEEAKSMIKLEIRETQVEEVTILDMSGDITIGDGNVALRHIIRQLLGEGRDKILLNMKDVRYVDSSGIGELISSFTMITRRGGQLKIINLTQRMKELLVITKLLTVFDVYESEAKALGSFQVSAAAAVGAG
jgi:anti-sigma B factor antagonist